MLAMALVMTAVHCAGQAANDAQSQRKIALALEQQGKNAEAEAAWRRYSERSSLQPGALCPSGLLEARQERYKEAVPLYRKALVMNPAIPGLRMNLGLALFKGGELKQAIAEFESLLPSQPPDSAESQRLTILIGMALYGLAEYAEAVPL